MGCRAYMWHAELTDGRLKRSGMVTGFIIQKIDKVSVDSPDDVELLLSRKADGSLIEGVTKEGKRAYNGFGW